jgi:hypothetical protein
MTSESGRRAGSLRWMPIHRDHGVDPTGIGANRERPLGSSARTSVEAAMCVTLRRWRAAFRARRAAACGSPPSSSSPVATDRESCRASRRPSRRPRRTRRASSGRTLMCLPQRPESRCAPPTRSNRGRSRTRRRMQRSSARREARRVPARSARPETARGVWRAARRASTATAAGPTRPSSKPSRACSSRRAFRRRAIRWICRRDGRRALDPRRVLTPYVLVHLKLYAQR